jgi:hypothetical protein
MTIKLCFGSLAQGPFVYRDAAEYSKLVQVYSVTSRHKLHHRIGRLEQTKTIKLCFGSSLTHDAESPTFVYSSM